MGLGELFRWLGCVRFLALLIFCSRGDCSCSHVLSNTRPPARLSLILTPSEVVLESRWVRDVHGGNVLSGLSWKNLYCCGSSLIPDHFSSLLWGGLCWEQLPVQDTPRSGTIHPIPAISSSEAAFGAQRQQELLVALNFCPSVKWASEGG